MQQHDQRADANVIDKVGEREQEDGGQVVDHLLFKILVEKTQTRISVIFLFFV